VHRVRTAIRTLARHRSYTSVVVLSLAVAIALNTTLYSVLDALMFPKLEMQAPERLFGIQLFGVPPGRVDAATRDAALRSGMQSYVAITRENTAVIGGTLIQHGRTFRDGFVSGVDPNYFDVLGARPRAGRFFLPGDETSGASVAVISEKLASALFPHGQVPVGQTITIRRHAYIVIGVASDRANFPNDETAVWTLARPEAWTPYSRIGRLRDGATSADAARELALVSARIAGEAGLPRASVGFLLRQLANPDFQLRDLHVAMLIAVIAVLLIACANVANIQLARGIGRRRELALRSALGADRNRLVADLLIESSVLVFGGLMLVFCSRCG